MSLWLASIRLIVSGRAGSCEMWFSRITSSSSSGRPKKALSSMDVISLAVRSILFSLSGEKQPTCPLYIWSSIPLIFDSCSFRLTHEGEVGLVDLGDSVVAGVEVSGVFGKRRNTIQLQVIAVDRTAEACAQQARGHTWKMWTRTKRRRRRGGRNKMGEIMSL